jgi:hypothetical protein
MRLFKAGFIPKALIKISRKQGKIRESNKSFDFKNR